jgi:hypothetical protein
MNFRTRSVFCGELGYAWPQLSLVLLAAVAGTSAAQSPDGSQFDFMRRPSVVPVRQTAPRRREAVRRAGGRGGV